MDRRKKAEERKKMPRVKKAKDCYRSLDDSRRPKCRKFAAIMCGPCEQADARYVTRRAEILLIRKEQNRQSAARSRDNFALKRDDVLAEDYALRQEEYECDMTLYNLEQERRQLLAAIHSKCLERDWRMEQVTTDISGSIIKNPDEAILYLCQTLGIVHEV